MASRIFVRMMGAALMLCAGVAVFGRTINVPADAATLQEAIAVSARGDTIVLGGNGPFAGRLDLREAPAGLTIQAADGAKPVVLGDASVFESTGDPTAGSNKLLMIAKDANFNGIHFKIDMSGLKATPPLQLARITGGKVRFVGCRFEESGKPQSNLAYAEEMVLVEGGAEAAFEDCQWNWRGLGHAMPDGAAYLAVRGRANVTCVGGRFGAIPEIDTQDPFWTSEFWNRTLEPGEGAPQSAAAVRIVGGGKVKFQACSFGLGEGEEVNAAKSFVQISQHGEPVVIEESLFNHGYRRGLMLTGALEETVILDRCIVRAPMLEHGQFFFAQAGPPRRTLVARNTVFHFYSTEDDALNLTRERNGVFEHCTFVDTAGGQAKNESHFIEVDGTTSGTVEITNSIFAAPRMAYAGAVYNVDAPGAPIAKAADNLLLHKAAFGESLPAGSYVEADPRLGIDMIHLLAGSPAIGGAKEIGAGEDIDGEARPAGRVDIGADQVVGNADQSPWLDAAAMSKENLTTPSADYRFMLRMEILRFRREWPKVEMLALDYLTSHPETTWTPYITQSLAENYSMWQTYLSSTPQRRAANAGKIEELDALHLEYRIKFLDATKDLSRPFAKVPSGIYDPGELVIQRLYS